MLPTVVEATDNAAAELQAQVCPMLDDLTEAAVSLATQNRSAAAIQVGSIVNLTDTLLSTVQSPTMISLLGKKAKALDKEIARLQRRITKAKLFLDEPSISDSKTIRAMANALSEGQRLRKAMLKVPASDTVVSVREAGTHKIALHHAGDVVRLHIDVRNDSGTPSCGQAEVSVTVLDDDSTKTVVAGPPSFKGSNLFLLTMGPDAGTVRVAVTICGQSNSLLLYNGGNNSRESDRAPHRPSNLAIMVVTPTFITLNWQDNSNDESGFHIERASEAGGPWELVGTVGEDVTSYTDTGLNPATTYYYRVSA
ncbi:MAG TPA: fibronectin type III domain-containing protein, partial [Verrucomicrobiae bacterium]|nr:fibronectin type III domain-containing protein [Verrucomicrobiae bacterium]